MTYKEFIENFYNSRKNRILANGLYHRFNETVSINLPLKKLIDEFKTTKETRSIVFFLVKDRFVDNSYDLIYLLPDDMYDDYVSKVDIDFDRRERQFIERILKDNDLYNIYVERIYIAVPSGKTRRLQMLKFNMKDDKTPNIPPEGLYDVVNFMNQKFGTDVLSLNKASFNEIVNYLRKIDVIPETIHEKILKVDNVEYFINTKFYAKSLFVLDKLPNKDSTEDVKLVKGDRINKMMFIPDNASIDSILTVDAYEKYAESIKMMKKQLSNKEGNNLINAAKEHIRKTIIDLVRQLEIPVPEYSLEVVPISRLKSYKGKYIVFPFYSNNLGVVTMEYKNIIKVMEMGIFSKKDFDELMSKLEITDYTYSFGLKSLMEMVYGPHLAASYNGVESLNRVLEIPPKMISRTIEKNVSMTIENMIHRCGPLFELAPLISIPQSYVYARLSDPSNQYLIIKIS